MRAARTRLHIAAAMDALRFRGAHTARLEGFGDNEWKAFLAFCDSTQLTLPLGAACAGAMPAWVKERLDGNLANNRLRVDRLKACYREIAVAFGQSQVKHLLLKGFAQSPDFAPRPELRVQSDLDLYCPPEYLEPARNALEALGYKPDLTLKDFPADHLPAMARPNGWRWRGNYYDPEMPPSVDVHFCLWNERTTRVSIEGLPAFWSRRVLRAWDGFAFPALSLPDSLAFSALHVLRDLLRGDWLLNRVYEMAHFLHLHAKDDTFWAEWAESHPTQLRSLQLIAFSLARSWFVCDIPDTAEQELQQMPSHMREWLLHFSNSPLESMYRPNKDAIWLHLSLLNSTRDRAATFAGAFLPVRIPPVGAPGQDTDGLRRIRRWWPTQPHTRYALHLIFRSCFHLRVSARTLCRGVRWWMVRKQLSSQFWTFFAAAFFFDLGFSIYFFLYGLYMVSVGYNERLLGLLTTAMSVGGIAGSLPAGILLRRFGIQRVLMFCFLSAAFLAACRAVFVVFPVQLVLAFLGGVALSIWAVSLSPTVAALVPSTSRPRAFSLTFSAGIGIGSLGALLGGAMPQLLARMHKGSLVHAERSTLLLSCCIVALGVIPLARLHSSEIPAARSTRMRLNPFLRRYLPCIAVWSLVTGAFAPFSGIYFARHFRMSLSHIGFIFSISQCVQVVAILLAPLLFRRYGVLRGITVTQLLTASALFCLSRVHFAGMAAAVYMTYVAAQWMNEPGLYTLLMGEVPAEDRADAAAFNVLVISSFQAMAAAFAGASISRTGYPATLAGIAAIAFAATLLFRLLLRNREPAFRPEQFCVAAEEQSSSQ